MLLESALHLARRIQNDGIQAWQTFLDTTGADVVVPELERLRDAPQIDQQRLAKVLKIYDSRTTASVTTGSVWPRPDRTLVP